MPRGVYRERWDVEGEKKLCILIELLQHSVCISLLTWFDHGPLSKVDVCLVLHYGFVRFLELLSGGAEGRSLCKIRKKGVRRRGQRGQKSCSPRIEFFQVNHYSVTELIADMSLQT